MVSPETARERKRAAGPEPFGTGFMAEVFSRRAAVSRPPASALAQ